MSEKKLYGPDIYKRNEHGLLENIDYVFNEDGSVDWRSMVKDEFLYPNKDWFSARKKDTPSSIDGLEDNQLLIMLGGIKELAKLRGYNFVIFEVENISSDYVVAKCKINWIGNYESCGDSIVFEDVANASMQNTHSFGAKFLETIACNRAFVRCVRNFLNIHIVGADEIDKSKGASNSFVAQSESENIETVASLSPHAQLRSTFVEKTGEDSFDEFKALLRSFWTKDLYKNQEAKDWNKFEDIPVKEARKIRALIKKL